MFLFVVDGVVCLFGWLVGCVCWFLFLSYLLVCLFVCVVVGGAAATVSVDDWLASW